MNLSAARMLRQIAQRLIRAIAKHHTDTINHDININRIRHACQSACPKHLFAPQLCIASTIPQNPGELSITTRVMTIPQQIQATKDTHGRQMAPPPNKPLLYGTLVYDFAGPTGVILQPDRHFTKVHLPEYHPLRSMFDEHTKTRIIEAHRRLKHLFQPRPQYSVLIWSWRFILATDTAERIPQLLPQISHIPGSARHDRFTLNVLARIPPPWTHTTQQLFGHCLIYRILPR